MSDAVQKSAEYNKKNAELFSKLITSVREHISLFKWESTSDSFTGYGLAKVIVSKRGFSIEEKFQKNNMEIFVKSEVGKLLEDELLTLFQEVEMYYNTVTTNNLLAKLESTSVQN